MRAEGNDFNNNRARRCAGTCCSSRSCGARVEPDRRSLGAIGCRAVPQRCPRSGHPGDVGHLRNEKRPVERQHESRRAGEATGDSPVLLQSRQISHPERVTGRIRPPGHRGRAHTAGQPSHSELLRGARSPEPVVHRQYGDCGRQGFLSEHLSKQNKRACSLAVIRSALRVFPM